MTDLPPDARALLASLAMSHEPPPDAAARVRAHVAAQLPGAPSVGARPWWGAVVGLGGVVVLAAWWSTRSPVAVPVAPAQRAVPAAVAPSTVLLDAPPVVAAAVPVAAAPAVAAPRPRRAVERDDLVGELRLIQQAQTALAGSDTAGAQSALRSHARTFPHGHLVEEREALGVQVLCASGRAEEARRAGAAFVARYPGSPQAGRVRRTCAAP